MNPLVRSIQNSFQEVLGFTPEEGTIVMFILSMDEQGWEFAFTKEIIPHANDNKEK